MLITECSQRLEIARFRGNAAHVARDRFDEHRSDLATIGFEDSLDRSRIIERYEQRRGCNGLRDACARRRAVSQRAAACFDEQSIRMAVITAGAFDDETSPRRSAREPDRAHRCLGAGVHKTHDLDRRHCIDDCLRQFALRLSGHAEARAAGGCVGDGFEDGRLRMSEDERAVAHHVVHVTVAIDVVDERAVS